MIKSNVVNCVEWLYLCYFFETYLSFLILINSLYRIYSNCLFYQQFDDSVIATVSV